MELSRLSELYTRRAIIQKSKTETEEMLHNKTLLMLASATDPEIVETTKGQLVLFERWIKDLDTEISEFNKTLEPERELLHATQKILSIALVMSHPYMKNEDMYATVDNLREQINKYFKECKDVK